MAFSPLAIVTNGLLTPDGGGGGQRVPVYALSAQVTDGQLSPTLVDQGLNAGMLDRGRITAYINDRQITAGNSDGPSN